VNNHATVFCFNPAEKITHVFILSLVLCCTESNYRIIAIINQVENGKFVIFLFWRGLPLPFLVYQFPSARAELGYQQSLFFALAISSDDLHKNQPCLSCIPQQLNYRDDPNRLRQGARRMK